MNTDVGNRSVYPSNSTTVIFLPLLPCYVAEPFLSHCSFSVKLGVRVSRDRTEVIGVDKASSVSD